MVRAYKSRHIRGKWTLGDMTDAMEAVSNGLALKTASDYFRVPRNTLRRKIAAQTRGLEVVVKVLGKHTVLTCKQEEELVQLLLSMERHLFGLSMQDLRRLVFQFCEKNKIKHPFNKTAQMAGVDWARSFMKRHNNLSIRKPQGMSIARAIGFNKDKVSRFFTALEGVLFEGTELVIPDGNVFNVDETGVTVCQAPQKIIAEKGKKNVSTLTSAERGKTVTIVCCASGDGVFIPPMMIFPRVRMKGELTDKAPNGTLGVATKSGWINEDAFLQWFNHFLTHTQPKSREKPVLLIMDGHSSHTKNLPLIDKARENNVILLALPSHCTHRLQPLDVSFFKSLKSYYNKEVQSWLRRHPGRAVTEYQIAELFSTAYGYAASVGNCVSGFRKCGIIPFKPDIFTDEDFSAAQVTERELPTVSEPCETASQPVNLQQPVSPQLSTAISKTRSQKVACPSKLRGGAQKVTTSQRTVSPQTAITTGRAQKVPASQKAVISLPSTSRQRIFLNRAPLRFIILSSCRLKLILFQGYV
jgi:hypothetical protein